jgi:hypothetical protein
MAERNAIGRPTVMTPATVSKLEEAFAYGCSDSEACFYADISKQTLYEYQKKNPEFIDRKEALKERPILAARQKVVQEIANDVKNAQWYLERKRKDEFSQRTEIGGSGQNPIRMMIEKFGLDKEDDDDGQDDGDVQISSPEQP